MAGFLERIAKHLVETYGGSLGSHCLVFPGRRAGLYFQKYLSSNIPGPVWSPGITTINELFRKMSGMTVPENEMLIFILYNLYKKISRSNESFDSFYFWGEMILNDFDDVDKHLADASKLFANITDLKNIDSVFGELTPGQVSIIRQFWVNFNPASMSDQKQGFIKLWTILNDLYNEFKIDLRSRDLAYEGMLYRDLAGAFADGRLNKLGYERFHFIGFNALNDCERLILSGLKKAGIASFYWDYDNSFIDESMKHSAGYFMKNNLKHFGNDMPDDWSYDTLITQPGKNTFREIIESSSDVSQVKMIPFLLGKIPGLDGNDAHHTAIVLADENLLVPVLSSIPAGIKNVNVTMGYPVRSGPVYNLICQIIKLHSGKKSIDGELYFVSRDVLSLISNEIAAEKIEGGKESAALINESRDEMVASRILVKGEFSSALFSVYNSPGNFAAGLKQVLLSLYEPEKEDGEETGSASLYPGMRNEMIYRIILSVNRLISAIGDSDQGMGLPAFFRILDKIIRGLSVPFSGEPLSGLQVMGILETRCLDFNNLIIMSVNEGIIPRNSSLQSFIPFNLREAFGLPTIRHQDSIYSYYFHRLLERCNNITFLYNNYSDGSRTGEMSRFLLQMKYLSDKAPQHLAISCSFSSPSDSEEILERSSNIQELLTRKFTGPSGKPVSPSALNTWLNCSMKFYFRYICGLKEPEPAPDTMNPALFGEILHDAIRKLYDPLKGLIITGDLFKVHNSEENLRKLICETINNKLGRDDAGSKGRKEILNQLIINYINAIINYDTSLKGLKIGDLEKKVSVPITVQIGNVPAMVSLGGIIDRIDHHDGHMRIIDYKTGTITETIDSVGSLFDYEDENRNDEWFQLLTYCEIFSLTGKNDSIIPVLYGVRLMNSAEYSGKLKIKSYADDSYDGTYRVIRNEFSEGLRSVIETIFDNNTPFKKTGHLSKCKQCPYRELCNR